jgi:UDP-N-acetyl-D-galactosamine dehydrogenase
VGHKQFREQGVDGLRRACKKNHVVYDVKYVFPAAQVDGRL